MMIKAPVAVVKRKSLTFTRLYELGANTKVQFKDRQGLAVDISSVSLKTKCQISLNNVDKDMVTTNNKNKEKKCIKNTEHGCQEQSHLLTVLLVALNCY